MGGILGIALPDIRMATSLPTLFGIFLLGLIFGLSLFPLRGENLSFLERGRRRVADWRQETRDGRHVPERLSGSVRIDREDDTDSDHPTDTRYPTAEPFDMDSYTPDDEFEDDSDEDAAHSAEEKRSWLKPVGWAAVLILSACGLIGLYGKSHTATFDSVTNDLGASARSMFPDRPRTHAPNQARNAIPQRFESEDQRRRWVLEAIRDRQYDRAIRVLENPDRPLDLEERKLLLPALFGQGKYRESLKRICNFMTETESYKSDPENNPYFENLVLSVRALGLTSGAESADLFLTEQRQACGDQFSSVWVGIPSTHMINLMSRQPRYTHPYKVSDTDRAFLQSYRQAHSTDDPYTIFADYFLSDFDKVNGVAGFFDIGLQAELDDAVMIGSDAERLEKIDQIVADDLTIDERFQVLSINLGQLYGAKCSLGIRMGQLAFATRLVEIGEDHKFCLADLLNALSSSQSPESVSPVFEVLARLSEEERASVAPIVLEARLSQVGPEIFGKELEAIGFQTFSQADQHHIVHKIALTMLKQWGMEQTLVFLRSIGPASDWSMTDEMSRPFQDGLWQVLDEHGFDAGVEFIYLASGLTPDALNVAIAFDYLGDVEAGRDVPSFSRFLYTNDTEEIVGRLAAVDRTHRALNKARVRGGSVSDWKHETNRTLATNYYYRLTPLIRASDEGVDSDMFENQYKEFRKTFSGPEAGSAFDDALVDELLNIVSSEALSSIETWDRSRATELFKIGEFLSANAGHAPSSAGAMLARAQDAFAKQEDMDCDALYAIGMERRLREPLKLCLARKPGDSLKGKAFYLIASIARQKRDYEESQHFMERFIAEISDHALRDDILAELGWQAFRLEDYDEARAYFDQVTELYPDRNAADNAYYWLGKIAEAEGKSEEAGEFYTTIALREGADRLRSLVVQDRAKGKQTIADIYLVDEWTSNLRVVEVNGYPSPSFLRPSDQLIRVCGQAVNNIIEVNAVVAQQPAAARQCEVTVLRMSSLSDVEEVSQKMPLVPTKLVEDKVRESRFRSRR